MISRPVSVKSDYRAAFFFTHLSALSQTKRRASKPFGLSARLYVRENTVTLLFGKVRVDLDKVLPLIGNFIFHENGIYGTLRLAQAAVNTFIRVNVKLIARFMDAVHGANSDAGFIFDPNAGFGDYVRHDSFSSTVLQFWGFLNLLYTRQTGNSKPCLRPLGA